MVALALTWQAHLLTNARAPTHLRTRALCSVRLALRQAAAHTRTHRGRIVRVAGMRAPLTVLSFHSLLTSLPVSRPPPSLRLERVTTSLCVCRHLLSPHNELTYGPGLTSLGVVILRVTGDTPVHRNEKKVPVLLQMRTLMTFLVL